jgi:hypothetical protein
MLSDTWRHREAAAEALYRFLQQDKLPSKYQNNTRDLFAAATDIAMIACRDKLL